MHKGKSLKSGVEGVTCIPQPIPKQTQAYPIAPKLPYLCPMTEHQIQASIVAYFNANYPNHRKCLFHVQQKASNALEGARFKTLGVVAGVSDLILLAPNGAIYLIELKDFTGRQSDHQKAFQQQAESLGHNYRIIRSLSEFQDLLSTIPY